MAGLFDIDPKVLRKMTPSQILELRKIYAGDVEAQNLLAPADHYLFGRDVAATEGPLAALAVGAVAPAYYPIKALAKKLGVGMGDDPTQTSDPSWDQLKSAYAGLGAGLLDWSKSKARTAGLLPYAEPELPSIRLRKERKENKDLSVDNYLQNNGWML